MRTSVPLAVLFAIVVSFALGGLPARADGIVVPCPPPLEGRSPYPCPTPPPCPPGARCGIAFPNLAIKYHRVSVTIDNTLATTHVDQVFLNDTNTDLEGVYIFPLPADAAVSEFAMWMDGKRMEAQVLDRDKAREIYTSIVNQRRDPALLEYIGRGAFQARVYPIPARGEKRIELEYKQVLPSEAGLVRYVYPLNTEKFSSRPLLEASVSVQIKSREPLKAIYSSSHEVSVSRNGDYAASVGWESKNVRPDQDFALHYSVAQGDIGLNLLTYKPATGEDGFFVLLAAPKVEARTGNIVAKDVIYVLDVSGSMQGQKIEQARQALQTVIERLNPADRFNIITFSTGVTRYAASLRPASERQLALPFVRDVRAGGSTDVNLALLEALALVDAERPTTIIFMTDGLPTTGVTDANRIIANARANARRNVRLFTFGVGYDVNTLLLDSLAQDLRGASAYIKPNEHIGEAVSAFYARVSTPVLADLKMDWGGITVNDLYPQSLPDLFAGSQLVLAGRYRGSGPFMLTLKGTVNNQPRTYEFREASFSAVGGDASLARIWATRKIGHLLDQVRFKGAQRELVDEIVALSVRYGIVTPYTSFLVDETSRVLNQEGRSQAANLAARALATPASSGAAAVQNSQDNSRMGSSNAPAAAPTLSALRQSGPAGMPNGTASPDSYTRREAYLAVQYVGDRAFVNDKGVWTDTTFDNKQMTTQQVEFQSAEYYRLLNAHPAWARYFALGANVIVVLDGKAYEVRDSGAAPQVPPGNPFLQVTPAPGSTTPAVTSVMPLATPVALGPQAGAGSASSALAEPALSLLATTLGCLGVLLAAAGVVAVVRLRRT